MIGIWIVAPGNTLLAIGQPRAQKKVTKFRRIWKTISSSVAPSSLRSDKNIQNKTMPDITVILAK